MERTDYIKKLYQEAVRQKQDKLRARSNMNKTEPAEFQKPASRTNGFLFKMFMRKKNVTQNQEDALTQKSEPEDFKFTFFDQFDDFPVNITGENQSLDTFKKLLIKFKTHQLQQIRLIDIPRSGEKVSLKLKQKVQVVLSHFFPYQILFTQRDYQLTLSNKIQHYSKKYKSYINLSNARTFLEDKNKKPSYVLLVPNLFQDLKEVKHQFDQIILGLIDGSFNNEMMNAQKIKCVTYVEQRVGVASINAWKSNESFISIISACIHEILHILQFDHCFKKKCLMNLRPNNAGLTMCSGCLQKFHTLFGNVDFTKWFGQLSEVLRIIEQPEEANKLQEVYEALQSVNVDIRE